MSAIHEGQLAIGFLIATLQADSTLMMLAPGGIWRSFAPAGTAYPVCIVAFQGSADTLTANSRRLMVRSLYQVRASGLANDTSNVFSLASRIDIVLGGNQGLRNIGLTSGWILSCYRESTLQFDEDLSGTSFTHLGGIYSVNLQQM